MNVVDNPEDATIGVLYCKIANVSNLWVIQFGLIPNFSKQIHLQGLLAVWACAKPVNIRWPRQWHRWYHPGELSHKICDILFLPRLECFSVQDFEAKCEREVLHTILFYWKAVKCWSSQLDTSPQSSSKTRFEAHEFSVISVAVLDLFKRIDECLSLVFLPNKHLSRFEVKSWSVESCI